jgi:hypothetical protein
MAQTTPRRSGPANRTEGEPPPFDFDGAWPDPERPPLPRLTVGQLLIGIGVLSTNCAVLAAVVKAQSDSQLWLLAAIVCVWYDAIGYLTLLTIRTFALPNSPVKPSWPLAAFLILIFAIAAACPAIFVVALTG